MGTTEIVYWLNSLDTLPFVIIMVIGTFVLIFSQTLLVILFFKFVDYVKGDAKRDLSEVKK